MNYMGWSFIGMHALWWLFWIALIVAFFALIEPVPRGRRASPLEVLQRRYATGEISAEEYEERKARLERDAHLVEK